MTDPIATLKMRDWNRDFIDDSDPMHGENYKVEVFDHGESVGFSFSLDGYSQKMDFIVEIDNGFPRVLVYHDAREAPLATVGITSTGFYHSTDEKTQVHMAFTKDELAEFKAWQEMRALNKQTNKVADAVQEAPAPNRKNRI